MPDISKCNNKTCVKRDKCYRFTCKSSEFRQSWGEFEPTLNYTNQFHCDYFMKIPKK